MKKLNCLIALAVVAGGSGVQAQKGTLVFPKPAVTNQSIPPLPTIWVDTNYQPPEWSASRVKPAITGDVFVFEPQQNGEKKALLTPTQAQGIIDRFKAAYPKLGSPRYLIYVNRDLVAAPSGTNAITAVTRVENSDGKAAPVVADKQTADELERLFALTFRQGKANLVDQKVAAAIIADKPITGLLGASDTAPVSKERAALGKIADVVIEILISPKSLPMLTNAKTQTNVIPDIQATAIRLSDSKIVGQAASYEVPNRFPPASLAGAGLAEVAEATALALMDDLSAGQ